MLRPKTILGLGIWILLITVLGVGLPSSWQASLYILTGVFLVFNFLFFTIKRKSNRAASNKNDTFIQNGDTEGNPVS